MRVGTSHKETSARGSLRKALLELDSGLGRLPALDEVAFADLQEATGALGAASTAFRQALSCAEELACLDSISEQSVVLLAVSQNALAMVRECLSVLAGQLDCESASRELATSRA